MLDRERACKKVGPSVAILNLVHDAKGADSQVRSVASRVHRRCSGRRCGGMSVVGGDRLGPIGVSCDATAIVVSCHNLAQLSRSHPVWDRVASWTFSALGRARL